MSDGVFQPMRGKTVSIVAGGTTGSASVPAEATHLRFLNTGTVPVFVRWGVGAQTAVATDMPLAPGPSTVENFAKGRADTVAAITAGDAATIYITPGVGE